jgi:L-alanine-DL-glutamate epimerase-like enolase superfamily enzyme
MARLTHVSLFQLPAAAPRAPRRIVVAAHADGAVGWSICPDVRGCWDALERLGAAVLGQAPSDANRRHAALGLAGPPLTHTGDLVPAAALDNAVLDLAARLAGVPLALWLGGQAQPRVRVADRVNVTWTGAPGDPSADIRIGLLLEKLGPRVAQHGFSALSIRPGKAPASDIATLLARLRDSFGLRVTLRLDLSAGYPAAETRALAAPAKECGVDLIILRGRSPLGGWTPVAVEPDPSLQRILLSGGLAQAVRVEPTRHGGAALAQRLAALLRTFQLEMLLTGTTGHAIELALLGQLARATPTDLQPLDFGPDPTALAPLAVRDGLLVLPPGPGLGFEVDAHEIVRAALRHTEVRTSLAAAS